MCLPYQLSQSWKEHNLKGHVEPLSIKSWNSVKSSITDLYTYTIELSFWLLFSDVDVAVSTLNQQGCRELLTQYVVDISRYGVGLTNLVVILLEVCEIQLIMTAFFSR